MKSVAITWPISLCSSHSSLADLVARFEQEGRFPAPRTLEGWRWNSWREACRQLIQSALTQGRGNKVGRTNGIAFNAAILRSPRTGIGQYVAELVRALRADPVLRSFACSMVGDVGTRYRRRRCQAIRPGAHGPNAWFPEPIRYGGLSRSTAFGGW